MITATVLYDLPEGIGLEECRAHYAKIAPGFLDAPGLVSKQFICMDNGQIGGGVYMWKSRKDAEAFYSGPWLDGIRARYGGEPTITYYETLALTDTTTGKAGPL